MAAVSNLYYPQLRKLVFPIIKYPGGVSDALRQHREAVRYLLGREEPLTRPSSWDEPDSPRLESIFDFPDPASPPSASPSPSLLETEPEDGLSPSSASTSDDEGDLVALSIEPADDSAAGTAETAAVHNGTDAATLALVQQLHAAANGLRSSRRAAPVVAETRTPSPAASATASPPSQKKRKLDTRCAQEHESTTDDGEATSEASPSKPKKQKRPPTELGDLIGQNLPAAVQAEVNFISTMPKINSGFPSRNKLRKAPQAAREISRKSGYLMTLRRGGSLRRWFGDESVFEMSMWRWLVGEHEDGPEESED